MRKAQVVYEDRNTFCFLDRYPLSEGHTLIIPRRHAPSLLQLTSMEASELMSSAQKVSRAAVKAYGLEGFNLIMNDGSVAGQGVPHVHLHMIPRFAGDGISTPHGRRSLPEEKMEEAREKILRFI
jgi:histidine triad (HIT) family protein